MSYASSPYAVVGRRAPRLPWASTRRTRHRPAIGAATGLGVAAGAAVAAAREGAGLGCVDAVVLGEARMLRAVGVGVDGACAPPAIATATSRTASHRRGGTPRPRRRIKTDAPDA